MEPEEGTGSWDAGEAVAQIERAAVCEDVFGTLASDAAESLRRLASRYRQLGKSVHPDRHATAVDLARRAHDAFVKLTRLRGEAERKIGAGTYGDRRVPAETVTIVATRRRAYRVGDLVWTGDVCDLRACSFDGKDGAREETALFKIARSAADDDLVENEAKILGRLVPRGEPEQKFLRYLPRLLDSFRAPFGDRAAERRRVNVLASFGTYVSLEDVRAAHPSGLDFRDVVWIWKRLLVGLGFAHRQGVIHGAILPAHVLVHPIEHGARIIDWCYATSSGERVPARVRRWVDLYPREIANREPATPATDIFMAARCVEWLLDGTAPRALTTFLSTCLAPSARRRPDDAWALHEEFDVLLCKLVGRPTYRALAMPAKA